MDNEENKIDPEDTFNNAADEPLVASRGAGDNMDSVDDGAGLVDDGAGLNEGIDENSSITADEDTPDNAA